MKKIIGHFKGRLKTAKELLEFLWQYKMWWLMPIVIILLLLAIIIVFASSSAVVPFVYTLF